MRARANNALVKVIDTATEYGMPVLAMAYTRDYNADNPDGFAEALGHAARLGEELEADIIKTEYFGTPDSFERIVESTRLPVLIAGGSKGTDKETLSMVQSAVEVGVAGVSMGRSIFQHKNSRKYHNCGICNHSRRCINN